MQETEYLEIVQVANGTMRAKVEPEVPHRIDVFTLGAQQAEEITYIQEVIDKVMQRRQKMSLLNHCRGVHNRQHNNVEDACWLQSNLYIYKVQRT